jgi:hypothetical protein
MDAVAPKKRSQRGSFQRQSNASVIFKTSEKNDSVLGDSRTSSRVTSKLLGGLRSGSLSWAW